MKRRGLMDHAVFTLAAQRIHARPTARSYKAARAVYCEGSSIAAASRLHKVTRQKIHVAIRRIEDAYEALGICPYCGGRMREV